MKRMLTIFSVIIIANFGIATVVSAEKRVSVKTLNANRETRELLASDEMMALSEYKRYIAKEFAVGSLPTLSMTNTFGNINIIEGADDKIIFKITVTGKGKNKDAAKSHAESVEVDFKQSGNNISAKTVYGVQCTNCARSVDYDVIVPKKTKQLLENKFGDISINNASEPVDINIEFGKLYANALSEAKIKIQHGGSTINRCEKLKINSGFSNHKLGEIGSLSGEVSHGGFDIEEVGSIEVKSSFSKVTIERLKKSISTKGFSHGSLRIKNVDKDFSDIKIKANFSSVRVAFDNSHNFKAVLNTSFGNIKTGNIGFYEKTLDKKDAVVGVAGKIKDPSSLVEISTKHGNIAFE